MKEETDELDLEECVNKMHAEITFPQCEECEGFNYNCPSYYSMKAYVNERGKKYESGRVRE